MCEGLDPDIFRVGDDGIVSVPEMVTDEQVSVAAQAVLRCPTEALRLCDDR